MNDFQPQILETEGNNKKNRFPIVAQLGILSVVMLFIFGSIFVQKFSEPEEESFPVEQITNDEEEYELLPQKIEEEVALTAHSAFVWDVKGQRKLYSKNADEALPLASITKLMTSLLAHELVSETQNVIIPISAVLQEGDSGLAAGEELYVDRLMKMAVMSSSNDAAHALAASVGSSLGDRDPVAQFVTGMNIRAEELDLHSLDFKNTTGLDLSPTEPGAVGSARDVSFLLEHIITNYPQIITSTQDPNARVYNNAGAYHEVDNTNEIALEIPNMIGSKTGYTDLAGGNLTIAFDAGLNRPMIVTVMGSTRQERFNDVLKLVKATQNTFSRN